MESFAIFLEPYRDLIATLASVFTYVHQLSGVLICNDIRKKKTSAGMSAMPFIAGLVITVLLARFGVILNDETTIKVNLFGVMLNIAYICYYYIHTNNVKDKTMAWAQMGYAGAFLAAIISYTIVENPEKLPFRFGMILTAVLFYFVGSPLLSLGEIVRRKSTEGMPFPIILSGTIISFLWLLYGIVMREGFVIFQNVAILFMSVAQLSLFVIFPSTPKNASPKAPINNNNNKKKN